MKRFGEKATREAIANGAIIRAWDWYTLEAGYRVIIDGETAGYIVGDLFAKLHNDGTIIKDHWAHSYTDYKAAQEITTAEAAETLTDALQMFERCGVISNLKVEPLTAKRSSSDDQEAAPAALEQYNVSYNEGGVYQTILVNAASIDDAADYFKAQTPGATFIAAKKATRDDQRPGKPCLTVPADFRPAEAEKTAQEWNEESDRVQAATLAALAPVIAAEEAAPAAEAAQEAPAEEEPAPEYLEERWPESNAMPGIAYVLEWNTPGSTTHHTDAATVDAVRSHVQQIKHQGGCITKAVRIDTNAGKCREFIPETRQEKTDRENWEHCRHIAKELDAYAAGDMYKCPHCGNVHAWSEYEESEHENDDGDTCYCCPGCEWQICECDLEAVSLYDFFADCFDIEYRCGSDREYRSVCIMVACGGPNIYVDTASKNVELYWWTDRAQYPISYEAADAVDDWAREYWDCL